MVPEKYIKTAICKKTMYRLNKIHFIEGKPYNVISYEMFSGHDERINIMDEFTSKVHFAFYESHSNRSMFLVGAMTMCPFYNFYEYFFSKKEIRKFKLKEIYEGSLCR